MTLNWEAITAILAILFGASGFPAFLFYRERKKTKSLENDALKLKNETTVTDRWKDMCEKQAITIREKDTKIEDLYKQNGKLRDENNTLTTENAVIKLLKCETVGCDKRIPPLSAFKRGKSGPGIKNSQEI